MKWKTTGPSEYLAITGWGIPDIKLAKKEWIFPGQKCTKFDVSPVNYTFEVQAMSAEKLPFILPAVFTIGPVSLTWTASSSSQSSFLHMTSSPTTSKNLFKVSLKERLVCLLPL